MPFNKLRRREKIKRGIRSKIQGTPERPRLAVFRSNKAIYAQIIDDENGHTLTAASSREIGVKSNTKIEDSKNVGKKLAEKAKAAGIKKIIFDRAGYRYQGKVKALADGVREGGLEF